MIRAIRRGYFAFPGSAALLRSYGYVFGLADSVDFVMDHPDPFICYNSNAKPPPMAVRITEALP